MAAEASSVSGTASVIEEWDNFARFRHDLIHHTIARVHGLQMSELPITVLYESLQLRPENSLQRAHYSMSHKLTPDMWEVDEQNKVVRIYDVGVSGTPDSYSNIKSVKYGSITDYFKDHGWFCTVYPLIFDPSGENVVTTLASSPLGGVDGLAESIREILDDSKSEHKRLMSKPELRDHFSNRIDHYKMSFRSTECINPDIVMEPMGELSMMEQTTLQDWEMEFDRLNDYLESICTSDRSSNIFPIPLLFCNPGSISQEDLVSRVVSRESTVSYVADTLKLLTVWHSGKYEKNRERPNNYPNKCRIVPAAVRRRLTSIVALGPGRKGSGLNMDVDQKNKSISPNFPLQEFNSLLDYLGTTIHIDTRLEQLFEDADDELYGNMAEELVQLSKTKIGWYLLTVQRIYQELAINCMRKRSTRDVIVSKVPSMPILILIHPGPIPRTDQNQFWFTLIYTGMTYDNEYQPKQWSAEEFMITRPISADSQRLEYYSRIFDLWALSCKSMAESARINLHSLLLSSNVHILMGVISAECRSTTSSMAQDIRYIVMQRLSINNGDPTVLSRWENPLRSVCQVFILKRMRDWIVRMADVGVTLHKSESDSDSDDSFNIELKDTKIMIPTVICNGPNPAPFHFVLNEMYYCMLYNKDRANRTHDERKVLKKLWKGEMDLGMKLGQWPTERSVLAADHLFNTQAVHTGSELLWRELISNGYTIRKAFSRKLLSKSIADLATFKASSISISGMHGKYIKSTPHTNGQPLNIDLIKTMGRRTKCIENIFTILENELLFIELADKIIQDDIQILSQVFKKNQIGGVREIHILDIASRVSVHLVETVARSMCMHDPREMLTKGRNKTKLMNHRLLEKISQFNGEDVVVYHVNADMTKWGPNHIVTEFIEMFKVLLKEDGSLLTACLKVLDGFLNKSVELPRHLFKEWMIHPEAQYHDPIMQNLKEYCLKNNLTSIKTVGGMWQGILHYTSSLYHCVAMTYRDEMFERKLKEVGIPRDLVKHFTLLSSDDRYDCLVVSKQLDHTAIYNIFNTCTFKTEDLYNIIRSPHKTSVSHLVGEFNSVFTSSASAYSPLIKFSIKAAQLFNTSSYAQIVEESYSAIQQLTDNGASAELAAMAHLLNREYANSVYQTNPGDVNYIGEVPYQLGYYPLPSGSVIGVCNPEYMNYRIKDIHPSVSVLHRPYSNPLESSEGYYTTVDLPSTLRIRIDLNICRSLLAMRKRLGITFAAIEEMVEQNPLLTIMHPNNHEELVAKIHMKLFQPGADISLRNTPSIIYFGRTGAAASSKVFYLSDKSLNYDEAQEFIDHDGKIIDSVAYQETKPELRLFRELVHEVLHMDPNGNASFSRVHSYEQMRLSEPKLGRGLSHTRPISFPMMYQRICIGDESDCLEFGLTKFLSIAWGNDFLDTGDHGKYDRDLSRMILSCSWFDQSLNKTLKNLNLMVTGQNIQRVIHHLQRLFLNKQKIFRSVVSFSPSTDSIIHTMRMREKYCISADKIYDVTRVPLYQYRLDVQPIKWMLNLQSVLAACGQLDEFWPLLDSAEFSGENLSEYIKNKWRLLMSSSVLQKRSKVAIIIWLMHWNFIKSSELETMLGLVDEPVHQWVKSQSQNEYGRWTGPFIIKIRYSKTNIVVYSDGQLITRLECDTGTESYVLAKALTYVFTELTRQEHILENTMNSGRTNGNYAIGHTFGKWQIGESQIGCLQIDEMDDLEGLGRYEGRFRTVQHEDSMCVYNEDDQLILRCRIVPESLSCPGLRLRGLITHCNRLINVNTLVKLDCFAATSQRNSVMSAEEALSIDVETPPNYEKLTIEDQEIPSSFSFMSLADSLKQYASDFNTLGMAMIPNPIPVYEFRQKELHSIRSLPSTIAFAICRTSGIMSLSREELLWVYAYAKAKGTTEVAERFYRLVNWSVHITHHEPIPREIDPFNMSKPNRHDYWRELIDNLY